MNKKELDVLEAAYEKDITGGLLQVRNKTAVKLTNMGYLELIDCVEPATKQCPFPMRIRGYTITHAGIHTYCSSSRCK